MLEYTINVSFTANAVNAGNEALVVVLVMRFVNVAQDEADLVEDELLTCLTDELHFRMGDTTTTGVHVVSVITITIITTTTTTVTSTVAVEHSVKRVYTFIYHFNNLSHYRLRFVFQHTCLNIGILRFELCYEITH
jgi:hypothetical protein